MEKNLQIKTVDKHLIYGTLNDRAGNKNLIIFVHGLTGNKNEHLFYNAAKFFPKRGFNVFRFDLYSGEKQGRSLISCSLETHADDLSTVIRYFKNSFEKIFLVGHSLGGPSILFSDITPVDSIVLWDPSFDILSRIKKYLRINKKTKKYTLNWGIEYTLSAKMINSWKKIDDRMLKLFSKPTKIICAGQCWLYKIWQQKIPAVKVENEFLVVKNAGHCFDEEGTEEILFKETLKWFKKSCN